MVNMWQLLNVLHSNIFLSRMLLAQIFFCTACLGALPSQKEGALFLANPQLDPIFAKASYVSYELSGGRLGDNLLAYLHAKWLSYRYKVPLFYKPFPFASELVLSETGCKKQLDKGRVFYCPYFPEVAFELTQQHYLTFPIDWKDPIFSAMIKKLIAPKKKLPLIYPPKEKLSIAMHVRQGGGFDTDDIHLKIPLKAPPISFYIESLYKIHQDFPERPLYCYIFTDAQNPENLYSQIEKALPLDMNIIFDYRKEKNHHNLNVLEDLFSLCNFDILIRPESNFSIIPTIIHDYLAVYAPKSFAIQEGVVLINSIEVIYHADG